MRILIAPAKKMNRDTDSMPWRDLPQFLSQAERLLDVLRGMDAAGLKKLWKCSDQIAALNVERLARMDLRHGLTPAILAYEGIQYRYMAPGVFTEREYQYVQERLRILSGFYGMLRPFDGVTPYRLEMQARLAVDGARDLYAFWGGMLARQLFSETNCILNLASREYSVCISRHLTPAVRFVTCIFGEEQNGKVVEKGTMCKMARGWMVRYLAEKQSTKPEDARGFDGLGYCFDESRSDGNTYVFLKKREAPRDWA